MTTMARVTTWASAQTLTASALNGEFNNVITTWNNHDSGSSAWTNIKTSGTIQIPQGTAGAPTLAISGDTTTGAFQPSAGTFSVSVSGTEQVRFNAGVLEIRNGVIEALSGTAGAPGIAFTTATTTGFFLNSGLAMATAGTQRLAIDNNGNIIPGTAGLGTTATDGFIYVQSCAGTPTGVPTTATNRLASIYDRTNNKWYIYNAGWKGVTLA